MTDPISPPPTEPVTPEIDPGASPPEINEPDIPAENPPSPPPVDPGDDRPYG